MLVELVWMLGLDVLFVGLFVLLMVPLVLYKKAAYAVLKRNFIGYFSNPTGYVFLCLFVLLTSFSAFWPHEFFASNLANLVQLNTYLPFIMLVFIPAITMSIWAEERRQGTDELLLTLPAGDFDIVIGKYLAAASIFTASLLFSQLASYAVLVSLTLGDLDTGLLFTTYLGYWLIGLAMIAIGMVASFLTSNLTVGFILGAAFNAPLAFAAKADVIVPIASLSRMVSRWSFSEQFDDFGRGVVSLSSTTFFVMLIAVGIYLSMVLIGRRHWLGGRDGHSMLGHYLVRTLALIIIVVGANLVFSNYDLIRIDTTEGRVSSLSPDTLKLISEIKKNQDHTIYIDAFLGSQIPEDYVKTRFELVSLLKEFQAMSGGKVNVRIHDNLEPFSKEAAQADQRFGIQPQTVNTRTHGVIKDEQVILGAAFTCGLQKVVVPFFDYGIPVEYELIRSISTVASGERKKLGVVRTDAQLMGGFSFAGGQPSNIPKQAIVEELEKQYEVEEVDPSNPIETGKYDVLLAVQPSSLTPPELDNFVEAIRSGQPTAIFEDPLPYMLSAPGTSQPKRANPMMAMMGGGQAPPKGDIKKLWDLLGMRMVGGSGGLSGFDAEIVWQQYNPYKKLQVSGFGDEFVFIRHDAPGAENEAFNETEPITKGLEEILFPFPGAVEPLPNSSLGFTELVKTGDKAGTIKYQDLLDNQENPILLQIKRGRPAGKYILAARITESSNDKQSVSATGSPTAVRTVKASGEGEASPGDKAASEKGSSDSKTDQKSINVVYVADIDLLSTPFVRIRAQPDQELHWRFDNVTFVLNVLDVLAGDDRYVDIRKRKTKLSTLKVVEARIEQAREEEQQAQDKFDAEYTKAVQKAEQQSRETVKRFQDMVDELQAKQRKGEAVDLAELQARTISLSMQQRVANQRLDIERERLQRQRDENILKIRRDTALEVQSYQNGIKAWAVILPPIPPLLVGLIVFVRRRMREREGVTKSRLR
jgi:ABC-2 type transport system permease protein